MSFRPLQRAGVIRYIDAIGTFEVNGALSVFRDPGDARFEGFSACRRTASSTRLPRGPFWPGRLLSRERVPSFSAGSCCLSAPEGRLGACAWALRGFDKQNQEP